MALTRRRGFFLTERRELQGIAVGVARFSRSERELAFERIDEALRLISRYDPSRYRRLLTDLAGIVVFPRSHLATYVAKFKLCELEYDYVTAPDTQALPLAAFIVHEAMHARIDAWGVVDTPSRRVRIEHLCVRAQLAFSERLPEPAHTTYVNYYRAVLEQVPVLYSDEAVIEREIEDARHLHLPAWFLRAYRRRLERNFVAAEAIGQSRLAACKGRVHPPTG